MALDTFDSDSKKIHFESFEPAGGGKKPAVVVAYGTEGMNDPFGKLIRSFASELAGHGYVVMIPHYFERTDTTPGMETVLPVFPQHRDLWVETLGDAMAVAAGRADVQPDQIGLLGFSMGGHLVLRAAMSGTAVKVSAVVEFFAPIDGLGGDLKQLPPLLIQHGDADTVVRPEQSHKLERLLLQAGKKSGTDYVIRFYPGEEHGFKANGSADRESKQLTVEFLDKYLK